MSAKAISEFDGKRLLGKHLSSNGLSVNFHTSNKNVQITTTSNLDKVAQENPWVLNEKLVVKPDQLIKRRGKSGLLLLNATWADVKNWISERINKNIKIGNVEGVLKTFIVEPFVPHQAADEYYVCIYSVREGDEILFYHEGGIEIGDVDSKAERFVVETGSTLYTNEIEKVLLKKAPESRRSLLSAFIKALYTVYVDLHFTYLEINPVVVVNDTVRNTHKAKKKKKKTKKKNKKKKTKKKKTKGLLSRSCCKT